MINTGRSGHLILIETSGAVNNISFSSLSSFFCTQYSTSEIRLQGVIVSQTGIMRKIVHVL